MKTKNNNSSSYSSTSYSTGASKSKSNLTKHDSSYALWLYTTKDLRINNFSVYPTKSGNITIGLYNASGSIIHTYKAYVYGNQWNTVYPYFELNSYTYYYMAIKEANGIELSYHKSSSSEYSNYKKGSLQVHGYSSRGTSISGTDYYQYFYEINYSLKN